MMADMLLHGYVYMQAGMVVDMMGCNMCMDGWKLHGKVDGALWSLE